MKGLARMTWFASHIFAVPREDVIAHFRAQEPLARGLYRVCDLEDHEWHCDEVRHGLPPEGLLVCRELCDTDDPESFDCKWFGDDAIPWWGVCGRASTQLLPPRWGDFAVPREGRDEKPDVEPEEDTDVETPDLDYYPPESLLRFLKDVSTDTATPTAYYFCSTWGGGVEAEYAWVFGAEESLYRTKGPPQLQVQTSFGNWAMKGDVLRLTLEHFGLELPTSYFALMTRGFPWDRYRLPFR